MASTEVQVDYLAIGANRHTAVADWSDRGIIAFGAGNNIALWRPDDSTPRGIVSLLGGHGGTVKAVKFLAPPAHQNLCFMLSGGDDCSLKLWALDPQGDRAECVQTVQEHSGPVNSIAVPANARDQVPESTIIVSGGADATIKIWSFEKGKLRLIQSIETRPKFFPLALALRSLNDSAFVLAAAGTRDTIQIFVSYCTLGDPQFSLQATLSGHEGWIQSLDFTSQENGADSDLLLASASQDKYIRLWRIHPGKSLPAQAATDSDSDMRESFVPGKSPSNKAHWVMAAGIDYSITFEALLLGHDDWIYSAKWNLGADNHLRLLSTSADNSLAIWQADPSSGIWVTNARLGELSRDKGATTATGSIGGFWTGLWSPSGTSVVTLGRTGSWRKWDLNAEDDQWLQAISISGHTKAVTGISWSGNGAYLLSTSSDQTTRLHGQWRRDGNTPGSQTWHEMSRPQIHGYDLNCISSLGSSQFVSGADEKLMRVFSEPKAVAQLISRLTGLSESQAQIDNMPDAANMPALGLSNKAIDAIDDHANVAQANGTDREALDPSLVVRKSTLDFNHPPLEDSLSRHTLWPEIEKIYGHGYEISCLAVSNDGKLIASACKASSLNHAVIRVFETERWVEVKPPLTAHTLTATRLRFSSDDRYLLSVGRDRQWAVFEREGEGMNYKLLQSNLKGHTRMILDCAWAPAGDRPIFATAGRDKNVRIWAAEAKSTDKTVFELATTIPEEQPVTAVDFLWRSSKGGDWVLAVGTESGKLTVLSLKPTDLSTTLSVVLKPELRLSLAVLQLAWRPRQLGDEQQEALELAIAGEDNSLRIYKFVDL